MNLIHESSVLIFGALLDDTEPMIYLTLNMYVVNNKLARSSSTVALIQSKLIFYIYISLHCMIYLSGKKNILPC